MMAYLLLQGLSLMLAIITVRRIWSASAVDGILSLIVPFYVLVPLVKHAKNPAYDIRLHVLALFVCGGTIVWMHHRLAQQYHAEQSTVPSDMLAENDVADDVANDGGQIDAVEKALDEADPAPRASLELGPASHAGRGVRPKPDTAKTPSESPATVVLRDKPVVTLSAPAPVGATETAPVPPPTLRQALATATYHRGYFERDTMGLAIDLPEHFHALAAADVHRIEASQQQPVDAAEVAWVMHESVHLSSAGAWYVRVRSLNDGSVAAEALDPWRLLRQAQHGSVSSRLAGSGGDLVGFAVTPSISESVVDWVEERLPAGAAATVLDCHALRLGAKVVVEFSVVGAPAGAQALCDSSVRLLARNTRFTGAGYGTSVADTRRAPYSLSQLVIGSH